MPAAGVLLTAVGFDAAGRIAVSFGWAAILVETLRAREVVFLRRWGVRRAVKPGAYWAVTGLIMLVNGACLYWLLKELASPAR